jgi:perosamine synthetase
MDQFLDIQRETGVPILEDCSHAHGARYTGRQVGSIGSVGAWSLQGSKPVSAGEGGMLATDDSQIFERACLAGQVNRMGGVDLATEKYADLQPLGFGMKFRAHPLGIGIASVQFGKLAELNRRRKAYVEAVEAGLADLPGLQPIGQYDGAERGGYYAFPIVHRPEQHNGLPTSELIKLIREEGLHASTSPYGLLHGLKIFSHGFDIFTHNRGPLCDGYTGYKEGDFPVTEEIFRRLIFLPILSDPVPDAVERVLGMLARAVKRARSKL